MTMYILFRSSAFSANTLPAQHFLKSKEQPSLAVIFNDDIDSFRLLGPNSKSFSAFNIVHQANIT